MGPAVRAVAARLRQPSTWAALAALAVLAGHPLPASMVEAGPALVALVAAALGVVLDERGAPG